MSIKIGEVIGVHGIKVTLKVFEESNRETLFYEGAKYKGVSIREYISIRRGFRDIICIIEGEYLDENRYEQHSEKMQYIRKVEAKPIGYFEHDKFNEGIKFLPMIKDPAFLMQEARISKIYTRDQKEGFVIGKMLKEELPISLPWEKLFNSHIGIFGNTGSGKSNTLAKLYTVLFEQKADAIGQKSKFAILDFNGEYTTGQFIEGSRKSVLKLDTSITDGDKFPLAPEEFWNSDTLCILFQATANTQRPFLNRLINGRAKFIDAPNSLLNYIRGTFLAVFSATAPKPEALDLLRRVVDSIRAMGLGTMLREISWHGTANKFHRSRDNLFFQADGIAFQNTFAQAVAQLTIGDTNQFDELIIRADLQLIHDLLHGHVQFEHIQPLLKRIDSSLSGLKKVIVIGEGEDKTKLLTVISLRKCNQDIKKVLPLLIAKHFYHQHKNTVKNPPDKTMHLIIDEAHNILSQQSSREHESWKDYRLELFEEIIKEGRKFGMFITLSSQRPADISPTIVSQLHNFFIHRLVNERDLYLLDNTISTLDNLSRSLIPNLSKGCCIITGTSFDLPMTLQIEKLNLARQPDSEDVNLEKLWASEENFDDLI